MPNELATKIIDVLKEIVSPLIAESALVVQCKKLNITTNDVTLAHINQICDGLGSGLAALGYDTQQIIAKIKTLRLK